MFLLTNYPNKSKSNLLLSKVHASSGQYNKDTLSSIQETVQVYRQMVVSGNSNYLILEKNTGSFFFSFLRTGSLFCLSKTRKLIKIQENRYISNPLIRNTKNFFKTYKTSNMLRNKSKMPFLETKTFFQVDAIFMRKTFK